MTPGAAVFQPQISMQLCSSPLAARCPAGGFQFCVKTLTNTDKYHGHNINDNYDCIHIGVQTWSRTLKSPPSAFRLPWTLSTPHASPAVVLSRALLPTCASNLLGLPQCGHTSAASPFDRPTIFTPLILPNESFSALLPLCLLSALPPVPFVSTLAPASALLNDVSGARHVLFMAPSRSGCIAISV